MFLFFTSPLPLDLDILVIDCRVLRIAIDLDYSSSRRSLLLIRADADDCAVQFHGRWEMSPERGLTVQAVKRLTTTPQRSEWTNTSGGSFPFVSCSQHSGDVQTIANGLFFLPFRFGNRWLWCRPYWRSIESSEMPSTKMMSECA